MSSRGRRKPASVILRHINSLSASDRGDEAESTQMYLLASSTGSTNKRPVGVPSRVRNVRMFLKRDPLHSSVRNSRNLDLGNTSPKQFIRMSSDSASTSESENPTPRTIVDRSSQTQALRSSLKAVFFHRTVLPKARDAYREERKNSPPESLFLSDYDVSPASKPSETDSPRIYPHDIKPPAPLERHPRHATTQPPSKSVLRKGRSVSILEKSKWAVLRWHTLAGKLCFFRRSAKAKLVAVVKIAKAVTQLITPIRKEGVRVLKEHLFLLRTIRKFQVWMTNARKQSTKRELIKGFSEVKICCSRGRILTFSNAMHLLIYRRIFGAVRTYASKRRQLQEFRKMLTNVTQRYAERELMTCLSTVIDRLREDRSHRLQLFRHSLETAALKHTEKEVASGLGDFINRLLTGRRLLMRLERTFNIASCRYTLSVLETSLTRFKRLTRLLSTLHKASDRVRILSFFTQSRSFNNPKRMYRIRYIEKLGSSLLSSHVKASITFLTVVLQALMQVSPLFLLVQKSTCSQYMTGAGKVLALCIGDTEDKERMALETLYDCMPRFFTGMVHSPSSFLFNFLRNLEADFSLYSIETAEEIRRVYSIRIEDVYTCTECLWTYSLIRYPRSLDLTLIKSYERSADGVILYPNGDFYAPDLLSAYPVESDSVASREIYAKTLLSYIRNPTFSWKLDRSLELETGLTISLSHYMRTVYDSSASLCSACNRVSRHCKQSFLRSTGSCLFINVTDSPELESTFLLPTTLDFCGVSGKAFQLSQVLTRSEVRTENEYLNYMETDGNWVSIDQGRISPVSKVGEALSNAQILIYREINS